MENTRAISEQEINQVIEFSQAQQEKHKVSYDKIKSEADILECTLSEARQQLEYLMKKEDAASSLFIPEHLNENQLQQKGLKLEIQEMEEKLAGIKQSLAEEQEKTQKNGEVLAVLQKMKEMLSNEETLQQLLLIAHKIEFISKLVGIDEIRTKVELEDTKAMLQKLINVLNLSEAVEEKE